jgi:hypothetical protein
MFCVFGILLRTATGTTAPFSAMSGAVIGNVRALCGSRSSQRLYSFIERLRFERGFVPRLLLSERFFGH